MLSFMRALYRGGTLSNKPLERPGMTRGGEGSRPWPGRSAPIPYATPRAIMPDAVSIEGPVELIDGQLTLRIPLAAGGDKLAS